MKKLFLIDFENSHWCGGQANVVVWAEGPDEATLMAESYMEEYQQELFSSEIEEAIEEGELSADFDCMYAVNSVVEFTEDHEEWEFFKMPSQAEFYPIIGEPD